MVGSQLSQTELHEATYKSLESLEIYEVPSSKVELLEDDREDFEMDVNRSPKKNQEFKY